MKLTLIEKENMSGDVTKFIFKPESEITWKPGQYLLCTLNHPDPDNRKTKRYFSISSAPHEKNVFITTRSAGEKGSSFKRALFLLNIGDTIEAEGPGGQFTLDESEKKYVFIAGGIGITAFRPMILDLDYRNLPINVTLLYANRTPEFVYKNDLENVRSRHPEFKINYLIDPERIDEKAIKKFVPDLNEPLFYVSGPEPMVEAMLQMLTALGISKEKIKRDYYPGYTWP